MELDLTVDESEQLRDILATYLVSVRREASRTEQRDMRHDLVMRMELCETLLDRLETMLVPVV